MCRRSRSRLSQVLAMKDFDRIRRRGKDSRKESKKMKRKRKRKKKKKKKKDRKRAIGGWASFEGGKSSAGSRSPQGHSHCFIGETAALFEDRLQFPAHCLQRGAGYGGACARVCVACACA